LTSTLRFPKLRLCYVDRLGAVRTAARTRTDAAGGFAFAGLTARRYYVSVWRGKWIDLAERIELVAGRDTHAAVDLPATAGAGKSGRLP